MNAVHTPRIALALLIALNLPIASTIADEDIAALEEVIVTANRREENLQNVAISVSAFTDEFFKKSGTNSLQQLDQYTPSLKISPVTDTRSTSIRIRGIGSVGTNAGIDPSVGMFIDGVYQGRAGMSIADLADIQRVEVLRGPQGTLYGKNTAAGALNITSKAPTEDFEATLELVGGNYGTIEARGVVNIPLGDSGHATRLSGFYATNDGFDENKYTGEDVNDTDRKGVRSRTLFNLKDYGELIVSLDYSKNEGDCCAPDFLSNEGDGSALGLPFSLYEETTGIPMPEADPYDRDLYFNEPYENEVNVGGIATEWNMELSNELVLTWINAWRNYQSDSTFDGDFSIYESVHYVTEVDLDQYSSEFRVTSPVGETWDYQAGVYLYNSEMDTKGQNGFLPLTGSLFAAEFFPGGFFPDGAVNFDTNKHETTSFAAFGQTNWHFRENWKATFGARFTREKKERDGTQVSTPDPLIPIDAPPIAGPNTALDDQRDQSDVSPMASLSYFPRDGLMLYASFSQGFKSGGFNQIRTATGAPAEFEDERSRNYEIGWKGTWLERRMQINGTVYYVDYDDFQTQGFDGNNITVRNAGTMESQGVELDFIYVPTAWATFGVAIGYNDASYSDFKKGECTAAQVFANTGGNPLIPPNCVQDLTDEDVDNSPEWTVSNFIQLENDFSNIDLAWFARLEYNYVDDFYMAQDLDESLKQESVDMVNARLGLSTRDDKWQLTLWGRNLLDEEYFVIGFDVPVHGGFAGINAPPLTYGVTLNYQTN